MPDGFGTWSRYARAHRTAGALAALVLLAALTAAVGSVQIDMPADTPKGVSSIPLWVLLPVFYASAAAASLTSSMSSHEQAAARPLWKADLAQALSATATAGALLFGPLCIAGAGALSVGAVRNLLLFTGLALAGGRLMGRGLSWILPLVTVFPFIWSGTDAANHPRSWAWPLLPPTDISSWIVAVGVFLAGLGMLSLSTWHLRWPPVVRSRGDG